MSDPNPHSEWPLYEVFVRTRAGLDHKHCGSLHAADPKLQWNEERQAHDHGTIDWSEFWRVVGGDGPCNRERLAARVKAWNDGAWVRDAALAHAARQAPMEMLA